MKAVIMAGGEGRRLRPLTCDQPKPLVPVCNRPVLAYILDLLAEHDFQEVFLTLGYKPEAVWEAFGDSYRGLVLHHVVEESPLGTAGSVAALQEQLDETFLAISGDSLTDVDLAALVSFHRQSGAMATLGLTHMQTPLEYGVVMTDRRGRIRRFLEKPGWGEVFSDTVNTGIYVLEPAALKGVPSRRSYDFSRHLFPALLQAEAPLYGTVLKGYWCDIGDPTAYLQANLDLLAGRLRFVPPGRQVAPGIWTEAEEGLPEGVFAGGPALIGRGCRIAHGARLDGGVILGAESVVERGALLRRSLTGPGVRVGAESTLVGAVVCRSSVLEAGTGVFSGAVVGTGCSIGARATLSPGVRIWPSTRVAPGSRVGRTLTRSPFWSDRFLRDSGLAGRLGAELLPEEVLKVGTALGTVLDGTGPVVVGADHGRAAALLKHAAVCGLLAAGRQVLDAGTTASPVTAHTVPRQWASGGIHIRSGGDEARVVFFDSTGRPATRELLRQLEQIYLRQEFHLAPHTETGQIERFTQAEWLYLEYLSGQVDQERIRAAGLTAELYGDEWPILMRWLERLHCKVVPRNGHLSLTTDLLQGTWRLTGMDQETADTLSVWLRVRQPREMEERVNIPVTAPRTMEQALRSQGRRPVRVRQADWWPEDPFLGLGRLLEWMAVEELHGNQIPGLLPRGASVVRRIECPWMAKGRVMRTLLEEQPEEAVELIDGLSVQHPEGWILLLPDGDEPLYRIYAEAADEDQAERLAERYASRVSELI